MITYVYTLADPRTDEIRYVGKTVNLKNRYADHLRCNGTLHVHNWIKQLRNLELKPKIEVLEECNSDWQLAEIYWIEQLRQWGFNLTNHAIGGLGGQTGRIPWNKGKKGCWSEEILQKMREASTGNKHWLGKKQKPEDVKARARKISGVNSPRAKFTQEQIDSIRSQNKLGTRNVDLARECKVRPSVIWGIVHNYRYKENL
jgi:hypothetical protein